MYWCNSSLHFASSVATILLMFCWFTPPLSNIVDVVVGELFPFNQPFPPDFCGVRWGDRAVESEDPVLSEDQVPEWQKKEEHQPQLLISDGVEVPVIWKWPWMAKIVMDRTEEKYHTFTPRPERFEYHRDDWRNRTEYLHFWESVRQECTGTIITEEHILTAAHCVDPWIRRSHTYVYVGKIDWKNRYVTKRLVTNRTRSTDFDVFYSGDIAILKLAKPIKLDGIVTRPICLNDKFDEETLSYDGETQAGGLVVGWGSKEVTDREIALDWGDAFSGPSRTAPAPRPKNPLLQRPIKNKLLQLGEFQFKNSSYCKKIEVARRKKAWFRKYFKSLPQVYLDYRKKYRKAICAISEEAAIEEGDGGAPLMILVDDPRVGMEHHNKRWVQIGISSHLLRRQEGETEKNPFAFTDISKYCGFINNVTQRNVCERTRRPLADDNANFLILRERVPCLSDDVRYEFVPGKERKQWVHYCHDHVWGVEAGRNG